MFTTGSMFCFGAAALLLVAAVLYGWTSGGIDWGLFPGALGELYFQALGAVTFGWRGPVGDHLGYTVLVGGAVVLAGLGGVLVATRDADASAIAEVARRTRAPEYRMPFSPNIWAPMSAFAAGVLVLGLVLGRAFFYLGLALLVIAGFEWAMQAWADRATGDPAVNARLRSRIMNPLEIPLLGAVGIGFVAIAVSRVLLAVSSLAAVWITIGAATLVFLLGVLVAAVPRATRGVLTSLVVVGALAVLAGGIGAAAVGEREFEHPPAELETIPESGDAEGGTGDEPITEAESGGSVEGTTDEDPSGGGGGD